MTTPTFDVEEDFAATEVEDLDVEHVEPSEDEAEDSAETPPAAKESKAKKEKVPARPPVAEGYITPVEFAKVLTEHLEARGASNKNGPISKENPVPPQMVYSYIKNNSGGKNPIPIYTDPAVTGGRAAVLKTEEALGWWDDKDSRIQTSKQTKAERDAAKKEKAAKATEGVTEAEDTTPGAEVEVEEAE